MAARVVLVDDHDLFRGGVRAILERQSEYRVVFEAADARTLLLELDRGLAFDLALVDVALPGSDGIALLRELRRRGVRPPTLLLTMYIAVDMIVEGLAAGARGYLFKTQPWPQLLDGMRAVLDGQRYLPPRVDAARVDELLALRRDARDDSPLGALSPREREVFYLLARGRGNAGIARELCISAKTVETHRGRIFNKLGVHSLAELVRLAARHQLLLPLVPEPSDALAPPRDALAPPPSDAARAKRDVKRCA